MQTSVYEYRTKPVAASSTFQAAANMLSIQKSPPSKAMSMQKMSDRSPPSHQKSMMLTMAIHSQLKQQAKLKSVVTGTGKKGRSRSGGKLSVSNKPRKPRISRKMKEEFYRHQRDLVATKEYLSES